MIRRALALALCCAACVERSVVVDVDARAVSGDASFDAVVYNDDGGGCAPWEFATAPALTVLARGDASAPLAIPREGDKVLVVDAVGAGGAVARGCATVGVVDDATVVDVVLVPTARIAPAGPPLQVVDDAGVVRFDVTDVGGAPVAGRAARVVAADGAGAVVFAVDVSSDDSGGVVVDVGARAAADGFGALTLSATVATPVVDAAAALTVLRTPIVDVVADRVAAPVPVVVDGAVAFVGLGPSGFVVDGSDDVLAPADARFLGAFFGEGGTRLFFAVPNDDGGRLRVVDVAGAVVDDVALPGFALGADVRAISIGACRESPLRHDERPLLLASGGQAAFVDARFGSVVFRLANLAQTPLLGDARRSLCVRDARGARRRVLFGVGSDAFAPVVVDGFDAIGDVDSATFTALDAPADVVRYDLADDGAVLAAVQADAIVDVHALVVDDDAGALVDTGAALVRLTAVPAFLARGALAGGIDDTIALLDVSSDADPDATALLVAASGLSVGGPAFCAPALACSAARVVDGRFFVANAGAGVRASFLR